MLADRLGTMANRMTAPANGQHAASVLRMRAVAALRIGRRLGDSRPPPALASAPVQGYRGAHTYVHTWSGMSAAPSHPVKPRRRGAAAASPAAAYVPRGTECAYANLKLLSRVLGTVYDDALRPVDLRASQLALLWAIAALEPVEFGRLGRVTMTDQTTLSRTVEKMRAARLVSVRTGADRRVRVLRLTARGRHRFAEAMPLWEIAQQRAAELLPLDQVRSLARRVRRATQSSQPAEA